MKAEKTPIELNGTKHLLFDLSSFYEFDKTYGSINKAMQALHFNDDNIPHILQLGLAHEEVVPIENLELLVDLTNRDTLKKQILQALELALPDPDKHKNKVATNTEADKGLDWDWLYYIGTVLLEMQETVFWCCTLRKLISLWAVHKRYNGLDKADEEQATASDDFIRNYM
ncbi:hypothetical protein [Paenibacillus antarcticus]|uniref:Uncharacterized protein n=1 Tax=Paenibacillus antarcticus TaxID=253703 RepID=A0A168R126_9BACL|nr:hypothetical protein [Paenibacillus antarcticus]OAB48456.1 hypothetical protein PBAT_02155 [Paenibacillus antarcticus]